MLWTRTKNGTPTGSKSTRVITGEPNRNKHRLYSGTPGYAKSTGLVHDITPIFATPASFVEDTRPAVTSWDIHGATNMDLVDYCYNDTFVAPRVIYEKMRDTQRCLSSAYSEPAQDENEADRRVENQNIIRARMQFIANRQDQKSFSANPVKEEGLYLSESIMLGHPAPYYLSEWLFYRRTEKYEWLMQNSLNREAVEKLRAWESLNEREYEFKAGPIRRAIMMMCESELFRRRCQKGPFDWKESIEARNIHLFDGRDTNPDDFLMIASTGIIRTVAVCREYFNRTGKPLPCIIILEEAINARLLTPFVISTLFEGRKWGIQLWIVVQNFPEQPLRGDLMTGCGTHLHYRPGDTESARIVGEDMMASYSSHEEHHTTTRLVHDGYEKVERISEQDGPGGPRTTVSEGERARYKEQKETVYKTPQQILAENMQQALNLAIGQRIVRDQDGIRIEQLPPLKSPFAFNKKRQETNRIIAEIRQSPLYEPPAPWTLPSSPPPTTPPALGQAPAPTPPTPRAGGGMRRS